MEILASDKRSLFLWGLWVATMALLVVGFLMPLLRLPVIGVMKFQECHGCSVVSALICVLGVGLGGVLWLLSRSRCYVGIALTLSGGGLAALLTCFFKLGSYLAEMLEALSTDGMDLSRVVQTGGWSLLSGLIFGLIFWFIGFLQFIKFRTKKKWYHES